MKNEQSNQALNHQIIITIIDPESRYKFGSDPDQIIS